MKTRKEINNETRTKKTKGFPSTYSHSVTIGNLNFHKNRQGEIYVEKEKQEVICIAYASTKVAFVQEVFDYINN